MEIPKFLIKKGATNGHVIRCDSTCVSCGNEKSFNYVFIGKDREICILCRECHEIILNKEETRDIKSKMSDVEKLLLKEILINRKLLSGQGHSRPAQNNCRFRGSSHRMRA